MFGRKKTEQRNEKKDRHTARKIYTKMLLFVMWWILSAVNSHLIKQAPIDGSLQQCQPTKIQNELIHTLSTVFIILLLPESYGRTATTKREWEKDRWRESARAFCMRQKYKYIANEAQERQIQKGKVNICDGECLYTAAKPKKQT